jgi:predicted RNase H-like HicB family nuclease
MITEAQKKTHSGLRSLITYSHAESYLYRISLEVYMGKKFTVVIEKDEDGWLVSEVVGLPGCHTQGKTMDQLLDRTKEAIKAYLEENDEPDIEQFVGVQQVEV